MAGGDYCFAAYEGLTQTLLRLTVAAEGESVRLIEGDRPERFVLAGFGARPVRLRDGRFLRLSVTVWLDRASNRLKVERSSYQYQDDEGGAQWLFRYDYIRAGAGRNPGAHFQVNGSLSHPGALQRPLPRMHFPTNRVSLEAVIRLLAEQFGVECATHERVWRPVLTASEEAFHEIAHRPLSGPPRG
jgi:hypothetical protein